MKYKCKSCGDYKELSEFGHYKPNASICWMCKENTYNKSKERHREVAREYRINNKDFIKDISKKYHTRIKNKFFEMYGRTYICCGESNQTFLTIEHIHGQRGIKKKDTSFKAYLLATREYRPDIYEVLCMNCNHAKGRLGYCPHKSYIHE